MTQSIEERRIESKKKWWREHPNYSKEYRLKNKEKIKDNNIKNKEYRKDYYQKSYEVDKDNISQQHKKYYLKNKKEIKLKHKEYYLNNKERMQEKNRLWFKNNPDKKRLYDSKKKESRKDWGIDPINEYFENSHFHHLHVDGNHNIGIYIPAELHNSIWHSNKDQESMDRINKAAIEWYN